MKQKSKTVLTTMFWQDAQNSKPDFNIEVMVMRKYKRHWKEEILLAYLNEKKRHGVTYGQIFNPSVTYDDYWSFPSTSLYETVTHWKYTRRPVTLSLIWKVIKTFAGFGSVNDHSICLTNDITGFDFHDYPESAGGDGHPDHFKEYECSICKHKYKI